MISTVFLKHLMRNLNDHHSDPCAKSLSYCPKTFYRILLGVVSLSAIMQLLLTDLAEIHMSQFCYHLVKSFYLFRYNLSVNFSENNRKR